MRVGLNREVRECGEEAEEVGDNVGRLVEIVAVDVSVDLFCVVECGAIRFYNSHCFPFQSTDSTNEHFVLLTDDDFSVTDTVHNTAARWICLLISYLNFELEGLNFTLRGSVLSRTRILQNLSI
jgi:hypothetical protein